MLIVALTFLIAGGGLIVVWFNENNIPALIIGLLLLATSIDCLFFSITHKVLDRRRRKKRNESVLFIFYGPGVLIDYEKHGVCVQNLDDVADLVSSYRQTSVVPDDLQVRIFTDDEDPEFKTIFIIYKGDVIGSLNRCFPE